MWCYIDMSHCEWAVCGYEGFFLVLFSLLYVGLVRFIIRLKYIMCCFKTTDIHLFLQMLKYVLPYKCNCIMISNTFNFV